MILGSKTSYIEDYIQNYNYDFKEREFNTLDNLVLSQIPYVDFSKITDEYNYVSITDAYELLLKQNITLIGLQKKVFNMLSLLVKSKRFSDIILSNCVDIVNEKEQFGAITITLNDNSKYIAFEGSDGSIIGWKENFALTYLYPTKTQKSAINYLNNAVKPFDKNIRVGGHSKGGNLAMAAYMESHLWIKNKIIHIYNNDGPGFKEEEFKSAKYQRMLDKLTIVVPENSIVGMLMINPSNFLVVKTNSFGIRAHSVFNWECNNNHLVLSNLSKASVKLNAVIINWLEKLNDEQKDKFLSTLFELFGKEKITSRFNLDNVLDLVKGIKTIDKETKRAMVEIISVLKECLKDNLQ